LPTPEPDEERRCVDAALSFARAAGIAAIKGADVRDVQPEALIVALYHGGGRPQQRSYFRVRRADLVVTSEERSRWWPLGVK